MNANLIKKITSAREMDGLPVENLVDYLESLEQYAAKVLNYTSNYNVSNSISYAPDNLVEKYAIYPSYGDFPETYTLRSYGKWRKLSEAHQKHYMLQDIDPMEAEDYVTLGFATAVVPRNVCIYETFNPGAVVRIWGRYKGAQWKLLWEGMPQKCAQESRKFSPPIRKINCFINEVRIELNQSHLNYHTSIDAVLLGGFDTKYRIQKSIFEQDLLKFAKPDEVQVISKEETNDETSEEIDRFSILPYEVILGIFQYLDLKSLASCAQVNKTFYMATLDPILYQNLSLKRYWHKVNSTILYNFREKCHGLKKLDLSWCGNYDADFAWAFTEFIKNCIHCTHLSLNHCEFVNNVVLKEIGDTCQQLVELRLVGVKARDLGFVCLSNLTKLKTLDLSSTLICDSALILILKSNPNLKHLLVDLCENLKRIDSVVETAANHNLHLKTWSSFKVTNFTYYGAIKLAKLRNLAELDLGWCFVLNHPGDCLQHIAENCKELKRLVISRWSGVNDQMLEPIIKNCPLLTQLDLVGIKPITTEFVEEALVRLKHLKLLDISFCDSVQNDRVLEWRRKYPNVTIQRNCQYVLMDFLN